MCRRGERRSERVKQTLEGLPEALRQTVGVIAILSTPTNLGLCPPKLGSVPGCAKAPEALREAGLHARLFETGAVDAGVILPGRYDDDADRSGGRVRNQEALVDHAFRLGQLLDSGQTPPVLGGDCSLLIGAGLTLARRGRHGLVHLDGHTDFRHPGNSDACLNLAGEDLAAGVGRHWPAVADLDGRGPYFTTHDVVHIGCRDDDDHLPQTRQTLGAVIPASAGTTNRHPADSGTNSIRRRRRAPARLLAAPGRRRARPRHLPAVDSPDPGGLVPDELTALLAALAPGALGAQVTVFDPDQDPDGRYARLLTEVLATGLRELGTQQHSYR